MDKVAERMAHLDEMIAAPNDIRRATLHQVWDKLMDAGNITGAQLVTRLVGNLSEGDWS